MFAASSTKGFEVAGELADGAITFASSPPNDVLLVQPDAEVPVITAGADGVHLLELARTAAALTRTSAPSPKPR